jgi:hypothetical protein
MTDIVDINKYKQFVEGITSGASNDLEAMIIRLRELNEVCNISLLMTGAIGIASEGGEFSEIVKKCVFQGKPLNACRAIGANPSEVIEENVRKLESRYPGGHFDVYYSENRKEGDL